MDEDVASTVGICDDEVRGERAVHDQSAIRRYRWIARCQPGLVRTLPGGAKRELEGFEVDYVDLDIQSGHRHGRFRIQPGDNITQESTNPYRYEISNDRPGYLLDQHGDGAAYEMVLANCLPQYFDADLAIECGRNDRGHLSLEQERLAEELRRLAVAQGMRTMLREAMALVENDVTTIPEVVRTVEEVCVSSWAVRGITTIPLSVIVNGTSPRSCEAPRNFSTYMPSSSASTMAGSEPPSRSGVT